MAENTIKARFKHAVLGDTVTSSSVPKKGEIIFNSEMDNFRVGNGTSTYANLKDIVQDGIDKIYIGDTPYTPDIEVPDEKVVYLPEYPTTLPASDVYEWAKQATKPSYAWSEITNKPDTFTPSTHDHDSRYYISGGTIYLGGNSIKPLTSFTETDPTVPAWAKQQNKPSYSWDEINDKPLTFAPSAHDHDGRYYISNGTIYLGSGSITPLTSHQSLTDHAKLADTSTKGQVIISKSGGGYEWTMLGSNAFTSFLKLSDLPDDLGNNPVHTHSQYALSSNMGNASGKNYTTSVTQNSSDLVTSGAVWTAIDNLPEPMVFKGSLGTGGTVTTLPTAAAANTGYTYKVITAGTYASKAAKVGDTFISTGSDWELIPSGDEPSGTVTSVGLSAPTGFSVSGSPVTNSGTLTLSFASGYSLPTTAKQGNWDTAYGWGNHASAGYVKSSGVTSVATSDGLTGGTITSTGTIKANLRTFTKLTNDSAAATETAGRIYPVVLDKTGYLAVNVPWTNVNNSYLTGITSSMVTTALGYTPYNSSNPNGYTSNTGTVTSVATGAGLTGGTISTSGTIKANLLSETKLTNVATAATEVAGRVYPVAVDKDGKLAVNVPWTNVNSSYLTGITSSMVTSALGYTPYNASNPNGYTSNIGTVTQVKLGSTAYNPSSGVVSLPAYPTTLPASDVYSWAKASSKPSYTLDEVSDGNSRKIPTKVSQLTNDSGYTTNTGTVTQVKVGSTAYDPSSGVVSLPAYPTTLPASDVYSWAKASSRPIYATKIETSSGTNQLTLAYGTKYVLNAGDSSFVFTMPASDNTWRPLGTGATDACAGNDSRLSNARPASDVYDWAKASTKPSYSWSEITGKPSTFTPSSHNHSQIVTEGDNRSVATKPNDYSNVFAFRGLKSNSNIDSPSSDTYSYLIGLRGWSDNSGGNSHEIAFNNSGIYHRSGSTTAWGSWYKLIDSGSISSQSVNYATTAGSAPASDVYSWAKASSKPSYSWSEIGSRPTKLSEFTNDVGFTTNTGTVTSVKVGSTSYNPSSGVVSLPAYPTTLPASDVYSWAKASSKPSYSFSEISGTVSSSQLPSYVDDVLEYTSKSSFPSTGESGKIYVATDTNLTYRWSGSAYVEISQSIALGETSSTAYRGDRGKVAYDHSQSAHARTDATAVTASSTNGNIKINGTETTVYTLPSSDPYTSARTPSSHTHGNINNDGTISSTAVTSATGILVYDSSNKIQRATAAQTRSIIGAGTSSFSGSYNDLSNKPTIPTKVSQLTNDSGYTTNTGTVTQVKVGSTAYNPSSGIVSLPAYPTTLPASDVYSWAKASSKPSYSWSEITDKPSSFTPASHTHNYAGSDSAGGAANSLKNFTTNNSSGVNANDVTYNAHTYYTSNGPATSLGASTNDGALYTQAYSSSWIAQIAQDYRNGNLYTRGKNDGTWKSWRKVRYTDDTMPYSQLTGAPSSLPASDVYSWAKASTKPSYSWSEISSRPTNVSSFTNDSGYITGITKSMVTTALGYTPPTSDTNTWRTVQCNSTSIGDNTLNLVAGTNVTLTRDGGKITITSTDTNTWRPISDAVDSTATDTSASSKAVKTAYDLAASKTANTGTVTKVSTGTGLTGGDITTSGTISINSTYQTYISNGNTAYGWGNHANAGYLTSHQSLTSHAKVADTSTVGQALVSKRGGYEWKTLGSNAYNSTTIPTNTNQLTNGAGFITGITSSMVTTALGYTPYNSSNPNGYTSNTGTETGISVNSTSTSSSSYSYSATSSARTYTILSSSYSGSTFTINISVKSGFERYLLVRNTSSSNYTVVIGTVTVDSTTPTKVLTPSSTITIEAGKAVELGILGDRDTTTITVSGILQ